MPETQTHTPLEDEPICNFCHEYCENGGNTCEPIAMYSYDEPRCCDECNIDIVLDIRIKMAQRILQRPFIYIHFI
jgi:hypothetical protein